MIESPYITLGKIISEDIALPEGLEIVASEAKGLGVNDREMLREAAEEIRNARKQAIAQAQKILELEAQLGAAADRIKALVPPLFEGIRITLQDPTQVNGLWGSK